MTARRDERQVLRIAMGLNALMFVVGIVAGYIADSLGLVADSLDMLADAGAYGLSLAAIGRSAVFKARVARLSGAILLMLGAGVMIDAVRRMTEGSEPLSWLIICTAVGSLAVNSYVIRTLTRFRRGEVHLRAAWLVTRADVVANIGVIVAGALVMATGSATPDIVIGIAIGAYVMHEAWLILRGA